jgi:hypothetical protein
MASDDPVTFRPRKLRLVAVVASVALGGLTLVGWLGLPASLRVLFSWSQRLTLLGLLSVILVTLWSLAASYVRADEAGLRLRNGLRSHQVAWERVHKILLRRGDPWAIVLIKPTDRPFEADLDAEKRQLMGIQAGDGESARLAVGELQRRATRYRET